MAAAAGQKLSHWPELRARIVPTLIAQGPTHCSVAIQLFLSLDVQNHRILSRLHPSEPTCILI